MTWGEAHSGGTLSQHGSSPFVPDVTLHCIDKFSWHKRRTAIEYEAQLAREEAAHSKDEWLISQAIICLNALWCATDSNFRILPMKSDREFAKRHIIELGLPDLRSCMLLFAALLSCQIPISAFEWVRQHFAAVIVKFEMVGALGLLTFHAVERVMTAGSPLCSVGRHAGESTTDKDLVLANH